jgi:predicted Rossmann fold nucleotide-binding protein DprA/Smf involved in DNA uptake
MISPFGRAALALDLLPLGVCKWDLAALLETPGELEAVSQERLDQLLYASPSARGKHVSLAEWNSVLEKADTEIAELNSLGASLITMFDGPETYPGRLLECYRPPVFLQILGDATVLLRDCIAIVGSRKPTPEGIRAASDFAGQLAAAGLVVVSGLAYGIDKAAHVGCLDAGGQTALTRFIQPFMFQSRGASRRTTEEPSFPSFIFICSQRSIHSHSAIASFLVSRWVSSW